MAEVQVDISENLATLRLCAPARRNAITAAMAAEVVAACDAIDANPSIGAVVVTGEGKDFCAGADRTTLSAIREIADAGSARAALRELYEPFVRVGRLHAPTIAAVRGSAVGAGLNLFLATDLRIVAHDARLIAGFQRIGLHPGGGHFTLFGRSAARETVMAVTVFGQELDGRRAVELGLAWKSVDAATVVEVAGAVGATVAGDPNLAREVVRSARSELGPPSVTWKDALERELGPQLWSLQRDPET
jgi:enoyl-CoA hydratase